MRGSLLTSLTILLLLGSGLSAAEKAATKTKKTSAKQSSAVPSKPYVAIGFALTEVTAFDSGYSAVLSFGKPLSDIAKNFGIEGTFATTLVDPSKNSTDLSVTTVAGYGTWNFELSPKVSIKPKLGVVYERLATTQTTDGFELSFGFKVDYPLENHKAIYIDYTVIESDISMLSAGLLFSF